MSIDRFLDRDTFFIDGDWAAPATSDVLEVVSPHSEEVVARVPEGSTADIDAAVAAARRALDEGPWPRLSPQERIDVVQAFSGLYAAKLAEMAELITVEMGSPTSFANLAQSPAPWMQIETFLGIAREFPWEEERPGALGAPVVVRREPVGVVAAIPPWNVPQFTIMSKLVPALLAGCTVVVKPAPETPLDGYLLAELLTEAGVPAGVVNIVAAGREGGEHLVAHPGVDKVAFTGSTAARRRIAAVCGEQLKRVSLELGGKSAAIVLDDADLATTMAGLRFTALMNSGQACVAQTRILASRRNYSAVVDALVETVASMPVGEPADPATEIGPLVAQRQQERVEKYIALGQEEGARVALGGNGMPDGLDRGWYVRPTVFADVDNRMRIAQEEIFGPVACLIPFDDEADAIAQANDIAYGLSSYVWTENTGRAHRVAAAVEAGMCFVNSQNVRDLRQPFGGTKASGTGREGGTWSYEVFLEPKNVAVSLGSHHIPRWGV